MSDLEQLLSGLYHPGLKTIAPGLERMERFLAALGNPESRIPPVIHVAGTNGKGSLTAYLRAIFEAAGMRVHAYTSPHLVRFNERIAVAGDEINDNTLMGYLKRVRELAREIPVTFFEATTAAAFLAFADAPADIALLEVGMGGRLDATNVIPKPLLTAITPVALDHCEYLGETLAAIAHEKAGIIKQGVACVIGRQEPEALKEIRRVAGSRKAPIFAMGNEWDVESDVYTEEGYRLRFIPSLAGAHQYDNAASAIACIRRLPQFPISEEIIRKGIASARWPGRLQRLGVRDGVEVWLDGGHNPHGAAALAAWARGQDMPLTLIAGMMRRKDAAGFFAPLLPYARQVFTLAVPEEKESFTAEELAEIAGPKAVSMPSLAAALDAVQPPARALICGSLYLAGYVLKHGI